MGGGTRGTRLGAWAEFSRVVQSMGRSRIGGYNGCFFQRLEVPHRIMCVPQRGWVVEECGGRGYRQSGVDEAGEISRQINIFRPASDTRPGQERERKERPRTGDCCVAE